MTTKSFVRLIICIAVLLSAASLVASRRFQPSPVPRPSSESLAIISSANSIETFRVADRFQLGSEKIDQYSIIAKGLDPNAKTVQQIKTLLTTNLQTEIDSSAESGCPPPLPGVALRFKKGEEYVDVLFCFRCYDLMVVNDKHSQWRNFIGQRHGFVKIAKSLFPGDATIQTLPDVY